MIQDILKNMTLEEKVGQMCVPILQKDFIPRRRAQVRGGL